MLAERGLDVSYEIIGTVAPDPKRAIIDYQLPLVSTLGFQLALNAVCGIAKSFHLCWFVCAHSRQNEKALFLLTK